MNRWTEIDRYVHTYTYIYIYIHMFVYIQYMERKRERERERESKIRAQNKLHHNSYVILIMLLPGGYAKDTQCKPQHAPDR